jgi:hypothetical protein
MREFDKDAAEVAKDEVKHHQKRNDYSKDTNKFLQRATGPELDPPPAAKSRKKADHFFKKD